MTTVYFDGKNLYADSQFTSASYKETNFKFGHTTKIVTDLPKNLKYKGHQVLAAAGVGSVMVVDRAVQGLRAFCKAVAPKDTDTANLTGYFKMLEDAYLGAPYPALVIFLVRNEEEDAYCVSLDLTGSKPDTEVIKHGDCKAWGSGRVHVEPFKDIKEFNAVDRLTLATALDEFSGGDIRMYDHEIEELVKVPPISEKRKVEIACLVAKHCMKYMDAADVKEVEKKRAEKRKASAQRRAAAVAKKNADKAKAEKKPASAVKKVAAKKAAIPAKKAVRKPAA